MLTNQIALAETVMTEDLSDWSERRAALQIRPLTECPRLRAAMGLTGFPTPAAAPTHGAQAAKAAKSSRRMPKNSSSPANLARTKHATKSSSSVEHPRFDRRQLLDSDY